MDIIKLCTNYKTPVLSLSHTCSLKNTLSLTNAHFLTPCPSEHLTTQVLPNKAPFCRAQTWNSNTVSVSLSLSSFLSLSLSLSLSLNLSLSHTHRAVEKRAYLSGENVSPSANSASPCQGFSLLASVCLNSQDQMDQLSLKSNDKAKTKQRSLIQNLENVLMMISPLSLSYVSPLSFPVLPVLLCHRSSICRCPLSLHPAHLMNY